MYFNISFASGSSKNFERFCFESISNLEFCILSIRDFSISIISSSVILILDRYL